MKQIIVDNISTAYYITEDGKCYNLNTGKFLMGQVGKNGYFSYNLTLPDGSKKRCYAHRLVAFAYLDPPSDVKKNQINHIDGNKLNNNVSNLEWVTAKENQHLAIEAGLRQFDTIYCFSKDKVLVAEYPSAPVAAKAVGINVNLIQQEINKEKKALSGGFYWSKSPELGEAKNYPNLGKAKRVNQYDLNYKFIMSYESIGAAARALGLNSSNHIGECCRGKIKTYKGFIWRYSEDIVLSLDES